MFNSTLTTAIENFTRLILPLTEKDLERTWIWKDHDEEGIRFACFVTLQELSHLAVTLAALRTPPMPAHRILSQYHASYLDLQATIFDISEEASSKEPVEGEWSVQQAYAHILGADIAFTAVIRHALTGHRTNSWKPDQMSDEEETRLIGMSEDEYRSLTKGSLSGMLTYHREFHPKIISEFSTITDSELELPSTFWEETRFPIQHRLHRYEAHFVQHTIQIDKTLVAIGQAPSEAKRLIRKIYAALAEAEGTMIGAEKMDDTAMLATASSIMGRTREIEGILSS